jgi:catechol 2,3-dioxygenase-like lactoylglutathione lyase family enzyme
MYSTSNTIDFYLEEFIKLVSGKYRSNMKLEYTGIRVLDITESLNFYAAMGLKAVDRGVMAHGGVYLLLEDPRTAQKLELNWYPPSSPYNSVYTVGEALDHLGFTVQDAAKSFNDYVSRGAQPALEPWTESTGDTLAFIKDPNGIWIELSSGGKTTQAGLEYVGLRVTDLGRALRLFRDTVGLIELGRGTMSHGGVWVDLLDPWTTQRLELNWYPRGSRFDWAYEPGEALDHIGLMTEDFESDYRKLQDAGCRVRIQPWFESGTRMAFLECQDGIWLELLSGEQKNQ